MIIRPGSAKGLFQILKANWNDMEHDLNNTKIKRQKPTTTTTYEIYQVLCKYALEHGYADSIKDAGKKIVRYRNNNNLFFSGYSIPGIHVGSQIIAIYDNNFEVGGELHYRAANATVLNYKQGLYENEYVFHMKDLKVDSNEVDISVKQQAARKLYALLDEVRLANN